MIDWAGIFREFRGQWVAIDAKDEQTVIASGVDPDQTLAKSSAQGHEAFLVRVPERLVDFVV